MIKLLFEPHNYIFNPHALVYFASGVLILAESIFIFLQNKKAIINFSFTLCTLTAGIWLAGVGFIYSSSDYNIALIWSRYFSWFGIIFVTPSVFLLSVSWKEQPIPQRVKRWAYFNFITALVIYLVCISTSYLVKGLWRYPWGFYPQAGIIQIPFMLWFYTLMTLSFRNFLDSYKKEKILMRKQQTKLIVIAFIFGFLGSADYLPNFGIPFYTFAAVLVLCFSTTIAYTIINYKLMEIETVIHKTIAWFLTSILLIMPLAVLLYFTRGWYGQLSAAGAWWYFGAVLLAFLVFVKTVHPKIDHFFQRRQSNLEIISDNFSAELVHLAGLNQLVERIKKTIADALYPQSISIVIYDEEKANREPFLLWLSKNTKIIYKDFVEIDPKYAAIKGAIQDYLQLSGAAVIIPLALNEKLLGIINLGKKANLKRYTAAEFRFLTTLKNQSSIAISNSLVYQNIEEQVKQRTNELVEVQRQLIQAEKLATVGTLAGGVAHEINNPLTAILTNVQMLNSENNLDTDTRESLALIEEATKRCRTIVQKLMAYAKKPLEPSQVSKIDLLRVAKNVIAFLGYQLEQENIKISYQAEEGVYFVLGNANELEQVLTNLILNSRDAIKKIKKIGNIDINISQNEKWVLLKVRDEGEGIPQKIIKKIFDPFFTTKEVGKGTGLGLSICQAIVEKHGGKISVESELGKGSTFTVQFPLTKEEPV